MTAADLVCICNLLNIMLRNDLISFTLKTIYIHI